MEVQGSQAGVSFTGSNPCSLRFDFKIDSLSDTTCKYYKWEHQILIYLITPWAVRTMR